ncbi:putative circularly permuted ATP-grasp superfamily protein/putative alpha-E superfamily protein [Sphingomonas leidyi]|uniref:Putative circularly permuted ATP-grasp superfamily protein/putative alpha-E superfamily protein n=1 Tax=Sphingomonas leidyi TaxID=68569 RepID=A0A7X5V193_9SPHN|nr:circularly permuted type 2 ATP-grasp protein [Sphingomonas leidyi]NIJ65521.1 putative circularly permuted ATP-grasp superfamily protein/putative alpha-E superfamily protein [Sphingomonas leidyi]
MASSAAPLFDARRIADRWIADYCASGTADDMLCAHARDDAAWRAAFEELAGLSGDNLEGARERARRHAEDIGTGFRVAGEGEERPWPLSPVPLLIPEAEWRGIAAGVVQRAEVMERVLADLYGEARLVADGHVPAALVTGSPFFLRPLARLVPPGGCHLQAVAIDLGRGPDGAWRVLADHLRAPAGAGYALENRLAMAQVLDGLQLRLNIARHAPFFAAFRDGLAKRCRRAEPRIALLTPGRLDPSYAEQAHLARYLGWLLVEGGDLAVLDDRLYVRTIVGLKRVDALWRRLDPRLLDPLALDSHSTVGVPGLVDAMAAGNVVIANAPGAGLLEAPAFAAFLPQLAELLTGEALKLPGIATWWCGQDAARDHVEAALDTLLVAPAFGVAPLGLPEGRPVLGSALQGEARAALRADMARRPQDYVGQEVAHLSTMPVVAEGRLVARPFTLRVFAARGADGAWTVLPGGFARIGEHADARAAVMGEGMWSADVCVHGADPVEPVSLLPAGDSTRLRRNPGTLPSRVADNMFWLGRYLERGEAQLGVIRVLLGNSISADTGAALAADTVRRLADILVAGNAAPAPKALRRADLTELARAALEGGEGWYSVAAINAQARMIGGVSRDRLAADMVRLLDAPFPARGELLDKAGALQRRYSALAGLAAEHMGRTDAWRFHDMGRRIERALATLRFLRAFGRADATGDDLGTLLDLADSQISYRQRYLTGIARVPVLDLVALDPGNPRGIAHQVAAISGHLDALPVLSDDGLAEPQQEQARELAAILVTAHATRIDDAMLAGLELRLAHLSDAVARRYFLQGAEPLRAAGLVLA